MRFLTLIARNLFRRRARTLLTATGLAVAIAAVLDLVGIAWNFERSFLALFVGKGIDLVVVRAGISNQLSSTLDQKLGDSSATDRGGGAGGPVADGHRRLRAGATSPARWSTAGRAAACSSGARISRRPDVRPRRGERRPAGARAGPEPRQEGRRRSRRRRRAVPGHRDLRERQPVRERRHGRAAGDAPADDGPRGPGHGLRHPGPVVRPGRDRRPAEADRGARFPASPRPRRETTCSATCRSGSPR